jgi:hypothetical protein
LTNAVNQSGGYEKKDVNVPVIIAVSIVSIAVIVVMIVILIDFFKIQKENMVYDSVLSQESKELVELRASEFETLNNYKLLDAEKSVYQIPIKRAMQLLTEEYSNSKK